MMCVLYRPQGMVVRWKPRANSLGGWPPRLLTGDEAPPNALRKVAWVLRQLLLERLA